MVDYKQYIPLKDSILFNKISKYKNWALLYLYLIEKYEKQQSIFIPLEIQKSLFINYRNLLLMLDYLVCIGYLKKHIQKNTNKKKIFYTPNVYKEIFIREDLKKIAEEKLKNGC